MNTESRKEEANKIIAKISLLAGGSTFLPTVLLQGGATTYLGYKLVKDLAELYDVPTEDRKSDLAIRSLISSVIITAVSEAVESTVKNNGLGYIGLGNNLSGSIINSFAYLTLGNVYRDHFEDGGTLETLNMTNFLSKTMGQLSIENIKQNFEQSTNRNYASLLPMF